MNNKIVKYPNAKINLGLNILRRRSDGFHDIETVFYPIPLYDRLEIREGGEKEFACCSPGSSGLKTFFGKGIPLSFTASGIPVPGNQESNLCIKAFRLLHEKFSFPAVHIHLEKNIPMGSGLGGGSSDAAFTLMALNELFSLGLKDSDLESEALKLGSDCPFFIRNTSCFAEGRGELLSPFPVDMKGLFVILVIPPVHISTAEAYSMIRPQEPARSLRDVARLPAANWKDRMTNDFEHALFLNYPVLANIKMKMYSVGAVYVSMSGSGSAVYGLFSDIPHPESLFPGCYVWISGKMN